MSEIRANIVSNAAGTGPVTLTGQYAAKAWCNVNGLTASIREGNNMSSVTDNGTGNFTFNLTAAMANSDFASSLTGNGDTADAWTETFTTSSFNTRWWDKGGGGALRDPSIAQVAVFGDLA